MSWTPDELEHGNPVKIKGFPKEHKVKLFRVAVSTIRTDFVATNDLGQNSTKVTQDACALRWKIEQFHHEIKQLTGIEKCQCRRARIQRNHIACAVLVWVRLMGLARKASTTVYQLKRSLLSDYLRQELRSPSIPMAFAKVLLRIYSGFTTAGGILKTALFMVSTPIRIQCIKRNQYSQSLGRSRCSFENSCGLRWCDLSGCADIGLIAAHFLGALLCTIVLSNQASFISLRNPMSMEYPDLSPITDSLPQCGHNAVLASASGSLNLLRSKPVQATISSGEKMVWQ